MSSNAPPPVSPPLAGQAGRRTTVVIVDDDDAVRSSLLRLLKVIGYEAKGYASGETFLADLAGAPADCVILDLLMPGMEGDRVLARMRDVWAGVPVIFITGTDEPGIQERLEAAGGCTCLIKPVDPRRLVEAIRAVVG